jgi:A/G-specific adenine glycosylase
MVNFSFCRKIVWAGCNLAQHKILFPKNLPWRKRRTAYRIFLAEILLVRTRADVVASIYEDIFSQYSDIFKLANANEDDLQKTIYRLGLSKRVPYIIKAARYICDNYNGKVPNDIGTLLKIPGVGIYTASAIVVFAYKQKLVPSDVNIFRFIARLTGLEMENKTKGSKLLRELTPFLSEDNTGLSTEKLLDFTRLICRPRNPLCEQCCLTHYCKYFRDHTQ